MVRPQVKSNSMEEKLKVFTDSLTDLENLPGYNNYSLSECIEEIKKDEQLASTAVEKCKEILLKWESQEGYGTRSNVVRCCMDLLLNIKGKDYEPLKLPPVASNLTVEEAEVTEFIEEGEQDRIEYDPVTNKQIMHPLDNLIIEEVDAAYF